MKTLQKTLKTSQLINVFLTVRERVKRFLEWTLESTVAAEILGQTSHS